MDMNNLLPPLVGSFFGVLSGFALSHYNERRKEQKMKKYYTKILKTELEEAIRILSDYPLGKWESIFHKIIKHLYSSQFFLLPELPTEGWTSFLSAGAMKLYEPEEISKIFTAFHGIKLHNERIEKLNNYIIEYHTAFGRKERKLSAVVWHFGFLAIDFRAVSLLRRLEDIDLQLGNEVAINADEAGAYYKYIGGKNQP